MDRLRTCIDALRVLARSNDPNRVFLIEDASMNISGPRLCEATGLALSRRRNILARLRHRALLAAGADNAADDRNLILGADL
jgi:hypothetical protein